MESKEVLQTLVCLDEVYKRINDGTATQGDLQFSRELLRRIKVFERSRNTSFSDLVDLAKRGEFCPMLYEKLKKSAEEQ